MDMAFMLTALACEHGTPMPRRYTGEGDDVSPPLEWHGSPRSTSSFALIVEDPDAPDPAAPKRVWVHWVLYDNPSGTTSLPEGVGGGDLPEGAARSPRYRPCA
ncbi:MAG: YbhB/YbcL family Raf kinase inhibitor-like protein [Planctomycetia bacterium]